MTTINVVKERTADAATSAVSEESITPLEGTDSVLSHPYCNENSAARQSLIKSLAQCQYMMGQIDESDRKRIVAAFPNHTFGNTEAALHFAVMRILSEHPQLRTEVQAIVHQMERNVHRTSWTVGELLNADIPPIRWIIPDFLPEGLVLLGGRPKIGKSLLALLMAKSIGEGTGFLNRKVETGHVLYLALEDNSSRLSYRITKQQWRSDAKVQFETSWPDLGYEGYEKLSQLLAQRSFSLVVVDTLSRAMDFNQLSVSDSSYILGNLQKLALEHHLSILIIDHLRKTGERSLDSLDVIEEILGSTGKVAVADAILGLFGERRSPHVRLSIASRDMQDHELRLELDDSILTWKSIGRIDAVRRTDTEEEVLAALATLGGVSTTTELACQLDRDKGRVSKVLASLVEKGLVVRGEREGRSVPYQLVDAHQAAET